MPDRSVRPATAADVEAVAQVQLRTWRAGYRELLPERLLTADPADLAAGWAAAVGAPPSRRHRLLVAMDDDGRVAGFAASVPAQDDDLDPATASELAALGVDPERGRRGHGSRLLAATVDLWRSDGTPLGVAWVWQRDDPTRGLLLGAGWAADGSARDLDTGTRLERQVRLHTSLAPAAEQPGPQR